MRYLAFMLLVIVARGAPSVVLEDDFSDGNLSSAPAWLADPTVNWYNPFHVEHLGGREWASCHRFGSMAAKLEDPVHPGWPATLDLADGPIDFAFDLRFEAIADDNSIGIFLLGREQRLTMRLFSTGRLYAHLKPTGDDGRQLVHDGGQLPAFVQGVAKRVSVRYSREAVIQISFDGEPVWHFDAARLAAALPLLRTFDSVAFTGTRAAGAVNVELRRSVEAGPTTMVRLSGIRVTGTPSLPDARPQPPLDAPPDSVSIVCSIELAAALKAEAIPENWQVVYAKRPHLGKSFRAWLAPDELRRFRWLVLAGVDARDLGWQTCLDLREYVRSGGNLVLLGGPVGVVSWLRSPLASALPVRAASGGLIKVDANEVAYLQPVDSQERLAESSLGAGRIRVLTWATVGNPPTPFWRDSNWLPLLLSTDSTEATP